MLKVAVTGTLCSGKSSLCRFLQECGAVYISADEIVHRLLTTQTKVQDEVIDLLGSEVVVDGILNKEAVARKVFGDEQLLTKLEQILHPLVREEITREALSAERGELAALFVVEIPLLFEVEGADEYDFTVAVLADVALSRKWYGSTDEEYDLRQKRQLSAEDKAKEADYIVMNDGDITKLKVKAKKLYERLLSH